VGTLEKRFWAKVAKSDSCWLWTAARARGGYGTFDVDGKTRYAHRVSWELANGPIPEGDGHNGTCVLHRCDVPLCCNPAHLFLGSHSENMADMKAKDRGNHGESNGRSKLTEAQVVEIRASTGSQRAIAARFGISQMQVSNIRSGQSWAHLTAEVSP